MPRALVVQHVEVDARLAALAPTAASVLGRFAAMTAERGAR
jgi:hypothetical protein